MLAAAIGVSAVTFAATVMHLRSQKEIKPIALKEMWKIRAYQEHTGRRDIHTNFLIPYFSYLQEADRLELHQRPPRCQRHHPPHLLPVH